MYRIQYLILGLSVVLQSGCASVSFLDYPAVPYPVQTKGEIYFEGIQSDAVFSFKTLSDKVWQWWAVGSPEGKLLYLAAWHSQGSGGDGKLWLYDLEHGCKTSPVRIRLMGRIFEASKLRFLFLFDHHHEQLSETFDSIGIHFRAKEYTAPMFRKWQYKHGMRKVNFDIFQVSQISNLDIERARRKFQVQSDNQFLLGNQATINFDQNTLPNLCVTYDVDKD